MQDHLNDAEWFATRSLITSKNVNVDLLNSAVMQLFPGEEFVANSADALGPNEAPTRIPVEHLNSLLPAGLPPHRLV